MGYSVNMKRVIFILMVFCCFLTVVSAQTIESPQQPEANFDYEPIRKGDQFIRIGLGVNFSMFNFGPEGMESETNIFPGGTGHIGYTRYISSKYALGGEINFAFNSTLGGNMLFYLPMLFRATRVFTIRQLQIPLSVGVGAAFQSYNGYNYFGLMLKPEIGAYYQFTPEWSFGFSSGWNLIPQWYADKADNRTANLLDIGASVRYHF